MNLRALIPLLLFVALVAEAKGPKKAAPQGDAARGAQIAGLAGCVSCHTADDGEPWAGGHAIETSFGTFYGTNLTQDREHGLGGWTYADFERAMREGRAPDKTPYYPAFPYPSFTKMTDADLRDLWAFLQTIAPVARPDRSQEALASYASRTVIGVWRSLEFQAGAYERDPKQSAAWNRGAYLVLGPGHCGECHTPRNAIGGLKEDQWLAGSDGKPAPAPNITPHASGIGDWSDSDLTTFLQLGMTPDGDFPGGEMGRIVQDGTSKLTDADRAAIVTYLRSVPPQP